MCVPYPSAVQLNNYNGEVAFSCRCITSSWILADVWKEGELAACCTSPFVGHFVRAFFISLFWMASSKGLGTKLMPITHVNGVKGLLSKLIQSVLMSIPLEMDTMQTLQLNSPHILLGKKIQKGLARGGGGQGFGEEGVHCPYVSLNRQGRFVWLSSLARISGEEAIIDARVLLSWDQFIKFYCPVRRRDALLWGDFIKYSWFKISSKCIELSGLSPGVEREGGLRLCSADSLNCLMAFLSTPQKYVFFPFNSTCSVPIRPWSIP